MRVLLVISRMNFGGTATYLNNLLMGLKLQGVEARLAIGDVSSGEIEDPDLDSDSLIRLGSMQREINPRKDMKAYRELNKVIDEYQPQIVHTHAFKAGAIGRMLPRRQINYVHTFHGHHLYDPEFNQFKVAVMNFIERRLANRSDALISVGSQVMSELKSVGVDAKVPFISIPPGINPILLNSKERSLEELDLVNLDVKKPIVLWMGRLVDVKRPKEFVDLARNFTDANFVIAGDGPLRQSLEADSPSNLTFVGWRDRQDLFSIADLLVSTSKSEGMPLAIIEAQSAGVPVIAPNVGSIGELLIDGQTGFLLAANLEDLHAKVTLLSKNSGLRQEMSVKAALNAKKEFSIDNLLNKHFELYERLID